MTPDLRTRSIHGHRVTARDAKQAEINDLMSCFTEDRCLSHPLTIATHWRVWSNQAQENSKYVRHFTLTCHLPVI